MKLRLIRHATLIVSTGAGTLMIDPMFSPAEAMPPIVNSANERRNPLVGMSLTEAELKKVDAVLLTHIHRDHFDAAAAERLPKDIKIFCQSEDEQKLRENGFSRVTPVDVSLDWNGLAIIRTGGEHGTGEIGKKMGPVSGYVCRRQGEPVLYIAGDTVWCPAVEEALNRYQPQVVVVFAGAASFLSGGPITMNAEDVARVCRKAPAARIVAVHMEAFNHCRLTRGELRRFLTEEGLDEQVAVPLDGESLEFPLDR